MISEEERVMGVTERLVEMKEKNRRLSRSPFAFWIILVWFRKANLPAMPE